MRRLMRWSDAHRVSLAEATACHDELDLDPFARVDVFRAFSSLGLKLLFRRLESCAALYLPGSFGSKPGALINSQHPVALQRYSGSHELGHHRFGHGPRIDRETELRLTGAALPDEEKLAEAFAAWFLMPPELGDVIFEETLKLDRCGSPQDVYAAALRFGASYTATCVHLVSLKRVTQGQSDDWLQLPLKKLKMALSPTPPPGGWRNDLWLLHEGDLDQNLLVRAGDRLIFDLPAEWQVLDLPSGALLSPSATDLLRQLDLEGGGLIIDLAPTMLAKPTSLTLTAGDREATITLDVERPREGLYVPTPVPVRQ
jgi:Zn-dependent peptidase ImmA (M78 family)